VVHGETVRKSLDLTNWEAACRLIRDWEIHSPANALNVTTAADKYLDDAKARDLKAPSIKKYKHVVEELKREWGARPVRSITVDDMRTLRQSWNLSGLTTRKRLEFFRGFFNFCIESGWIEKNPAKAVKSPTTKQIPTLPFSDDEIEKLLWAVDSIREIHPQMVESSQRKLRAMILLILHSGMRVSDALLMKSDRIKDGKLLIYTQKTGTPVWCPLPKIVLKALEDCEDGDPYYFWSGNGKEKSKITEWQERMKKACVIAGLPTGHFHRLRDTFSVRLLEKGVPLETVAILLGNTVQVCQKHYAPWVKSRQVALESAVKLTW
jgi:integrase